jgi:hypothetical protein
VCVCACVRVFVCACVRVCVRARILNERLSKAPTGFPRYS